MLLASCGIPTQDSAQVIDDAPPALFEDLPEPTVTTALNQAPGIILRLYWHTETGVLVRFERPLAEQPVPDEALLGLAQGPSEEEQARDPSTVVQRRFVADPPPQFQGVSAEGTARLRVADGIREADDLRLASAQIVCTALQFLLIDSVVLEDSLGDISLTDNDANPIEGPATAAHFGNCESPPITVIEPESTTTTTTS